jgi:hypothetical protein
MQRVLLSDTGQALMGTPNSNIFGAQRRKLGSVEWLE